jgi:hypothetical protein
MAPTKYTLVFTCDKCKHQEQVESATDFDVLMSGDSPEDAELPMSDAPDGWLLLTAYLVGVNLDDETAFCANCATAIIKAMGYTDKITYATVVKAAAKGESDDVNPEEAN